MMDTLFTIKKINVIGKEHAKRWTMMDAFFMMMPGRREETLVEVVLKLVVQYVVNLSVG